MSIIFPLINFLIFLYLIKRFLFPRLKDHLRSRREELSRAVRQAAEGRERAEAMLRDYRIRLARLEEEARQIRETSRREGEREKERLLREAGELARKIKADGEFLGQQEVKAARQQLRREMAQRALAAAVRMVRDHFTSADQERLAENFLTEVTRVQ